MKPASRTYFRPDTMDVALHLLTRYGDDAKVLAGGQSLVPLMSFRLVTRAFLIDITRLTGLDDVAVENGRMIVGALVRHRILERNPLVRSACPLLVEAAGHIGYSAIRTRGTVGGSLVHADPAAKLTGGWVAADGSVTLPSPRGHREVAAEDCSTTGVPGAAASISTELGTTSAQRPGGQQGPGRHGLVRYGLTRVERPAYLSRSSAVSGPHRAGHTLFICRHFAPTKDRTLCRETGCRGQQRGSSLR